MGLRDLAIPSETITFGKTSFEVFGLNGANIVRLVRVHGPAIRALYEAATADGAEVSMENAGQIASVLMEAAPDLVADIIALAAQDPEAAPIAAKLSGPVQLAALEKIADLTFSIEGGPKKAWETVIRVINGVSSLMGTTASTTGS